VAPTPPTLAQLSLASLPIPLPPPSLSRSLSTDFSRMGGSGSRTSRSSLFPSFGKLYPAGSDMLASAEDEEGIRRALARCCPEYARLWGALAPTPSLYL
jgi:hypothetical protein